MTDLLWVLVQVISPIFGIAYILAISEWRFSRKNTLIAASLYIVEITALNFFLVRSLYPSVESAFILDLAYRIFNNLRVVAVGFILARQNKARTVFGIFSVFVCVFVVDTIAISIRALACVHLLELIFELLLYPLMLFVVSGMRKPFSEVALHMKGKMWWFCVVPAVLYFAFILQVSMPVPLEREPRNIPGALMLCVITVVVYGIIIYLFNTLRLQSNFERNTMAMQIYTNALEHQNQISAHNARMAHVFRHDLRHITQLMLSCLDCGDTDGIRELLLNIDSNVGTAWRESYLRTFSGHKLVDSTLSHYMSYAKESGVEMTVDITRMRDVRADMAELAVVLANALENAIDACKKLPDNKEKTVRLNGRRHGSQFFLEIANTCEGTVAISPVSGLPLSTRDGHGLGSQSIAFFAQKYGAQLEYSQSGDLFHLRLLLQASRQSPEQ